MSIKHDVVLVEVRGERGAAIEGLMKTFGVDRPRATELLSSLPTTVKHGVSWEMAETFVRAFEAIGARTEIRGAASTPVPLELSRAQAAAGRVSLAPPIANGRAQSRDARESAVAASPYRDKPAWRRYVLIAAVVAAAALGYWYLRAPRMGGLIVHRAGADAIGSPTVVLLHGFGAPGDDLVGLANELAEDLPDIRFVVPEGRLEFRSGRAWWKVDRNEAEASRQAVSALIDELIDDGTAADEVVVAGFSQGAILAMEVALNREDVLGGVAFLSGKKETLLDWSPLLEDKVGVPILVSHGRSDSVLPFRPIKKFVKELESFEYDVEFVTFDGGHSIPPDVRRAVAAFVDRQLN